MKTLLWILLLTIPILPNLWCIWHAFHHSFVGEKERFLWLGLGIFVPVIGGLLYLVVGQRRSRPLS